MFSKMAPPMGYFLVGLGVGSLIGILYAPKSGEETRDYMAKKAREGSKFIKDKALELKSEAKNIVQRGGEIAKQQQDQIAMAIDAGREAYQKEKAKAHSA